MKRCWNLFSQDKKTRRREYRTLAGVVCAGAALLAALWPLGLTGIWMNFAVTALLAAVLAAGVLVRHRKELARPDAPPDTAEVPAGGEA